MLSHLNPEQVRIVDFSLAATAVLLTCFRLRDRVRTGHFWWDDAWAAITMVLLLAFMAVMELHLQDPTKHTTHVKLVIAYILPELFYSVTWSARMSILLTIIRISLGTMRKVLAWTGILFALTWLFLFAQIWWVCEDNDGWKGKQVPQCPLGTSVGVTQVITDVVCDAILILAPVRLVWRTKLTSAQKIRVTAIFSTTLITTAISLNHAYFVLKWGGLQVALAAILQCNVSLIVANLSVVIAFCFRINTEDEETVSAIGRPATALTLFFWRGEAQAPITSTFLTTGGAIRERRDTDGKNVYATNILVPRGTAKSSLEQPIIDKSLPDGLMS